MPASPPRRRGRPPAGDRSDTRERLVTVARRIFATNGYDAATNSEIAQEAGITTGAIYHYFPSKADLWEAAYSHVQEIIYDAFEKAVAERRGLTTLLDAVLDTSVALNRNDTSLAGFVVNVPSETQRHAELRSRVGPIQSRTRGFFERLVQEGSENGELAEGFTVAQVVDMIAAITAGLARFSDQTGDTIRHERAADALKALIDGRLFRPAPERIAEP
jgi:AcrR family transcriptional regulator